MEDLKLKLKQEIESYIKCNEILKIANKKNNEEMLFFREMNGICYDLFWTFIEEEEKKRSNEIIKPLSEKLNSHSKDIRIYAKKLQELIGLKKTIEYCSECIQISKNTESV